MQNVGAVDFGGILIRAIDVIGTNALVGCRNGNIYQVDLNTQSKQVIMESHSDGEVWGLAVVDQDTVVTTGDDNQIKAWSVSKRQCVSRGIVSSLKNKVKRGGASSLTQFPDSQCARAIAYCPQNGHIAVGHNDGTLTVRESIANIKPIRTERSKSIKDRRSATPIVGGTRFDKNAQMSRSPLRKNPAL